MSIVSDYATEAASAALKRQRRSATITSLIISLLVIVLLGLVLSLILMPGFFFDSPTIVSYQADQADEEVVEKPMMDPQVQRKPSAPSSSMAKVIASTTASPTAVPVPDHVVPEPSVEFGNGNDFGDGWGSGSGGGQGGGGTTFFGQRSKADRVAFVIDYSLSMKANQREDLMRKELQKSLGDLSMSTKYQVICFAGPAWVAGDEINWNQKTAKVTTARKKSFKWKSKGSAYEWAPDGKRDVPEWQDASKTQIQKTKNVVRSHELVWGTSWEDPLEMALGMDPPPQVIYFMTDGAAGDKSERTARTIGAKAKTRGIVINCVAMMEPKAHKSMLDLAKRTNGQFTIVHKGGKVEKVR